MSRVLLLSADLLFGSRVQAQLQAAGEEVELLADVGLARARLQAPAERRPQLLVVDVSDTELGGEGLVEGLRGPGKPPALGFYSHVEADTRARAERAGFDLVVPRSRMAREGARLAAALLAREEHDASPGGARQAASLGGTVGDASPGGARQAASPGGARQAASPGGAIHDTSPGGARQAASPGGAIHDASPGGTVGDASPGGGGSGS